MRVSEAVEWIFELFELTGYAVIERVGDAPGTVDRFARKREGRDRPLVLWSIWPEPPADLDAALASLEAARQRTGADRAVGLVLAFMAEVADGAVSVMGLREYVFDVSGITDVLTDLANWTSDYIERPATVDGQTVDPIDFIRRWAGADHRYNLFVYGRSPKQASWEAARLQAQLYLDDRGAATAVLAPAKRLDPALLTHIETTGWLSSMTDGLASPRSVDLFNPQVHPVSDLLDPVPDVEGIICLLGLPPRERVKNWYRGRLTQKAQGWLLRALDEEPALWTFFSVSDAGDIGLIEALKDFEGSLWEWIARYVISSDNDTFESDVGKSLMAGYFEHFALGYSPILESELELPDRIRHDRLLRDYCVAHHVADRFRGGDHDIVTRYRFPERYVLLFLAHIAPEAVAHATADRTDELRRQIADEAEREVQLTLSHHLRRSVGAARAQFKRIERALTRDQRATLGREIGRLHEELDYQQRLADRTRLYHEVPETETTDLDLIPPVERVTAELKRRYPDIAWDVDLPPTLYARAQPDGVYDILHNIVENAAHATLRGDAPRITLRALTDAETIRVEVRNAGPGIPPADRERIFDPRVTTKKGGDQPLGTGMGLPIARRYAATVGGRVDLDPDSSETCFVIRFVAARTQGRP